ncbi:tRNA (adenine37-N(6))-methyltransferase TrmN6 [alpha proteobacterium U9-1i]|nr:tRNA (adenine37-N(6))-methyltransferase TrmN6 [alpha proteobacterium U9-1i]
MSNGEFTEDAIFNGRVIVRQPKRGYRINLDTVLLAAAMHGVDNGRVIELGCGVGAALLAVAKASPKVSCVGIERDAAYAALARENIALNGVGDRVELIEGDALHPPAEIGVFDAVFFNPPYDDPSEGRTPSDDKRAAHVEERPIEDWIKVWSNKMSSGASLTLIHRAHRVGDILAALDGRLGGVEIVPIRPHVGAGASRIVVRARKGSRAPLVLWGGYDLHPADASEGKYTPEAEAILRGDASIWAA